MPSETVSLNKYVNKQHSVGPGTWIHGEAFAWHALNSNEFNPPGLQSKTEVPSKKALPFHTNC